MESIFAFLVKLLTIFIGGTFVTFLAYFIGKEMTKIPVLISKTEALKNKNENLSIKNIKKLSPLSGFYEISYNGAKLKIFSSPQEMKVI